MTQEFLRAVTDDLIELLAGRAEQQIREILEHRIARLMAVRIIDALEIIHIAHHDRQRAAVAARALDFVRQLVHQIAAVVGLSEHIGNRQPVDPAIGRAQGLLER